DRQAGGEQNRLDGLDPVGGGDAVQQADRPLPDLRGKVPPSDTGSHRNRQRGHQGLHVTGAQRHGVLPPVVNGLPKCPNHLAGVKRVRLHFTSLSVLASLTSVCQILPGLSTRSEKKVREVGSPSSACGNVSQCPTDDTL